MKPTAINKCRLSLLSQPPSCCTNRSAIIVENQPRKNDAVRLINKVPHGKPLPSKRPKATDTPQRNRPPTIDPAATSPICISNSTAYSPWFFWHYDGCAAAEQHRIFISGAANQPANP